MTITGRTARIPRELERSGALCLAFANTEVPRRDNRTGGAAEAPARPIAEYSDLVDWALRMGTLVAAEVELLGREAAGRPQDAATVAASGRELRGAVCGSSPIWRSTGSREPKTSPR